MDFISNFTLTGGQKKYLGELAGKIKSVMPGPLYEHSINSLEYAGVIAEKFLPRLDFFSLSIACILHDYGKIFSYNELVRIAEENKLEINSFELKSPPLLHGFIGDYLVSRDFNISEPKILKAIKFHTIGYCDMSPEDKILFISDKIEKSRNYDGAECLRALALKNINLCLLEVYKNNIIYITKGNNLMHPDTVRIWNNLCGGI